MANLTLDVGKLVDGLGKYHRYMRPYGRRMHGFGNAYSYWNPALTLRGGGLGRASLVPPEGTIRAGDLFLGFVLIPSAVGLAGRLGAVSGALGAEAKTDRTARPMEKSKAEKYVDVGAFTLTALYHYFGTEGRSSFWFGAMLGQIPNVASALGDLLVDLIKKAQAGVAGVAGATAGFGQLTREEIEELRRASVGSVVTDETRFEREMRGIGMDSTGYQSQMGSNITDFVQFQKE